MATLSVPSTDRLPVRTAIHLEPSPDGLFPGITISHDCSDCDGPCSDTFTERGSSGGGRPVLCENSSQVNDGLLTVRRSKAGDQEKKKSMFNLSTIVPWAMKCFHPDGMTSHLPRRLRDSEINDREPHIDWETWSHVERAQYAWSRTPPMSDLDLVCFWIACRGGKNDYCRDQWELLGKWYATKGRVHDAYMAQLQEAHALFRKTYRMAFLLGLHQAEKRHTVEHVYSTAVLGRFFRKDEHQYEQLARERGIPREWFLYRSASGPLQRHPVEEWFLHRWRKCRRIDLNDQWSWAAAIVNASSGRYLTIESKTAIRYNIPIEVALARSRPAQTRV